MITTLSAVSAASALGALNAAAPVSTAFGVGKAAAAVVLIFAFVLGAMFLGGHLGEASKRRRDKRRNKRH